MSPLIIGAGCCALAGLGITVWGRRGRRIDDHPICRRCQFDLVGLPFASAQCPECGGSLSHRRATRNWNRRRHRPAIALGLIMVLSAMAVGGVAGWRHVRRIDWITYKPTFLLMRDLRSLDPESCSNARFELIDRIGADRIGKDRMATLAREFDGELRQLRGRPAGAPTPPDAGDREYRQLQWLYVLGKAGQKGLLSREDAVHFLEQVVGMDVAAPRDAPSGSWVPMSWYTQCDRDVCGFTDLKQTAGAFCYQCRLISVTSQEQPLEVLNRDPEHHFPGEDDGAWHDVRLSLPPGARQLVATFRFDVFLPWNIETPEGTFVRSIGFPITVRPADEPQIELITDTSLANSTKPQVRVMKARVASDREREWLTLEVVADSATTPVVGRLTLRWEGQIVESNRHVQLGDRWARGCFETYWVELPVAAGVGKDSRLDVIITPDPDYAAIHTFVSRIWGEPIEILNVPVQWPP